MSIWDDIGDWIDDSVDYVVENPGKVAVFVATGVASIALAPEIITVSTIARVGVVAGAFWTGTEYAKSSSNEKERQKGREEGRKAGEFTAKQKYQERINELTKKFAHYQNFEKGIIAMYSVGLAFANEDRILWSQHLENLDSIIVGFSSNKLPQHIQDAIALLKQNPPTWNQALNFAKEAKLPKSDIDDIVDIIASVGDYSNSNVTSIWESSSKKYQFEVGA